MSMKAAYREPLVPVEPGGMMLPAEEDALPDITDEESRPT